MTRGIASALSSALVDPYDLAFILKRKGRSIAPTLLPVPSGGCARSGVSGTRMTRGIASALSSALVDPYDLAFILKRKGRSIAPTLLQSERDSSLHFDLADPADVVNDLGEPLLHRLGANAKALAHGLEALLFEEVQVEEHPLL